MQFAVLAQSWLEIELLIGVLASLYHFFLPNVDEHIIFEEYRDVNKQWEIGRLHRQ